MSYNLLVHFTGADNSYNILAEGFKLDNSVGAKGQHATQSCSLSIKSPTAVSLFLTETKKLVPCEIKEGSTVLFEGVARPYQNVSVYGNTEGNLNLEVMDYTETMHISTGALTLIGQTVSTIITTLYNLCNLTPVLDIPTTFGNKVIDYFVTEADDYVDDVLGTFLSEYGYDFKFEVGYCRIKPTTITTAPTTNIKQIAGTLAISRSDDWQDGLLTKYQSYAVCEGLQVVSIHKRYDDLPAGSFITNQQKTGIFYDMAEHDRESSLPANKGYINFDFNDLKIRESLGDKKYTVVGVSNLRADVTLEDEQGVTYSYNLTAVDKTQCRFYISYSGMFDNLFGTGWGWSIKIYGDVAYQLEGAEPYETSEGVKKKETTLKYVCTSADCISYNEREFARQKTSGMGYTFKSLVPRNAGDFFNLVDASVSGVSQGVRILSCTMDKDGIYSVKAEGANQLNIVVTQDQLFLGDLKASGLNSLILYASAENCYIGETVTIVASGAITNVSDNRLTFKWYLNGTEITGHTSKTLTINYSDFVRGKNTVKAEAKATIGTVTAKKDSEVVINKVEPSANFVYFGTRSWTDAQFATYGAIGYSDTWANNLGVAAEVGDILLLSVTLTDRAGALCSLYIKVTARCTTTTNPTGTVIQAIPETKTATFHGLINSVASIPTGEVGDYFVYTGTTGSGYTKGQPYVKGTSGWELMSASDPDNADKLMSCLESIVQNGTQIPANTVLYTWANNLVAQEAVINNLTAKNVQIGGGSTSQGFLARIKHNGGDPLFDVYYGGKCIFKIAPTSGNIFFGEPASGNTEPANGFMYRASDASIISKSEKIKIDSTGKLTVNDADIKSQVTITGASIGSATFEGQIDCASFSSLPGSGGTTYTANIDGIAPAAAQYSIIDAAFRSHMTPSKLEKATVSIASSVAYVKLVAQAYLFYDSNLNLVGQVVGGSSAQSTWSLRTFVATMTIGDGDLFKFKNLPTSSSGLESGQVWCDTSNGKVLKLV